MSIDPSNPNDKAERHQKAAELINQLTERPEWRESFVLKIAAKKLQALRDKFKQRAADEIHEAKEEVKAESELTSVYVVLHHQDGRIISNWLMLFKSLSKMLQGRPIYGDEASAQQVVDNKPDPDNEGYAVYRVSKQCVIPQPADRQLYDRNMQPLLIVQQEAVSLNNLAYFVHANRDVYQLQGKILVKKMDNSPT